MYAEEFDSEFTNIGPVEGSRPIVEPGVESDEAFEDKLSRLEPPRHRLIPVERNPDGVRVERSEKVTVERSDLEGGGQSETVRIERSETVYDGLSDAVCIERSETVRVERMHVAQYESLPPLIESGDSVAPATELLDKHAAAPAHRASQQSTDSRPNGESVPADVKGSNTPEGSPNSPEREVEVDSATVVDDVAVVDVDEVDVVDGEVEVVNQPIVRPERLIVSEPLSEMAGLGAAITEVEATSERIEVRYCPPPPDEQDSSTALRLVEDHAPAFELPSAPPVVVESEPVVAPPVVVESEPVVASPVVVESEPVVAPPVSPPNESAPNSPPVQKRSFPPPPISDVPLVASPAVAETSGPEEARNGVEEGTAAFDVPVAPAGVEEGTAASNPLPSREIAEAPTAMYQQRVEDLQDRQLHEQQVHDQRVQEPQDRYVSEQQVYEPHGRHVQEQIHEPQDRQAHQPGTQNGVEEGRDPFDEYLEDPLGFFAPSEEIAAIPEDTTKRRRRSSSSRDTGPETFGQQRPRSDGSSRTNGSPPGRSGQRPRRTHNGRDSKHRTSPPRNKPRGPKRTGETGRHPQGARRKPGPRQRGGPDRHAGATPPRNAERYSSESRPESARNASGDRNRGPQRQKNERQPDENGLKARLGLLAGGAAFLVVVGLATLFVLRGPEMPQGEIQTHNSVNWWVDGESRSYIAETCAADLQDLGVKSRPVEFVELENIPREDRPCVEIISPPS